MEGNSMVYHNSRFPQYTFAAARFARCSSEVCAMQQHNLRTLIASNNFIFFDWYTNPLDILLSCTWESIAFVSALPNIYCKYIVNDCASLIDMN